MYVMSVMRVALPDFREENEDCSFAGGCGRQVWEYVLVNSVSWFLLTSVHYEREDCSFEDVLSWFWCECLDLPSWKTRERAVILKMRFLYICENVLTSLCALRKRGLVLRMCFLIFVRQTCPTRKLTVVLRMSFCDFCENVRTYLHGRWERGL